MTRKIRYQDYEGQAYCRRKYNTFTDNSIRVVKCDLDFLPKVTFHIMLRGWRESDELQTIIDKLPNHGTFDTQKEAQDLLDKTAIQFGWKKINLREIWLQESLLPGFN